HPLCEVADDSHVVVVTMREQNGLDVSGSDRLGDRIDVVGGVDDDDLGIIADDPHVVVDVVRLPVEGECARCDEMLNSCHYSSTTDRRTWPLAIFSKADSTSPMPMRSDTNFSSGKRPCW